MIYSELQVGELYYDTVQGLLTITELYPEGATAPQASKFWSGEFDIGKYNTLKHNRGFKLYTSKLDRLNLATDAQIEEYILNIMADFDIEDKSSVIIYPDAIGIACEFNFVYLNKKQALKLKQILAREIV